LAAAQEGAAVQGSDHPRRESEDHGEDEELVQLDEFYLKIESNRTANALSYNSETF
jgi:hypothetical protein